MSDVAGQPDDRISRMRRSVDVARKTANRILITQDDRTDLMTALCHFDGLLNDMTLGRNPQTYDLME